MFWIRFLSNPQLVIVQRDPLEFALNLVLVVSNDLGTELLVPDQPLYLKVLLFFVNKRSGQKGCLSTRNPLQWDPSRHVTKAKLGVNDFDAKLPKETRDIKFLLLSVQPVKPELAAGRFLGKFGGIVQNFTILGDQHEAADRDCTTRRLRLGQNSLTGANIELTILERIGNDSLHQHVWDGGYIGVGMLARMGTSPSEHSPAISLMPPERAFMEHLKPILSKDVGKINILELGSGVGVFSLGLLAVFAIVMQQQLARRPYRLFLTDHPDAKGVAERNIRFCQKLIESHLSNFEFSIEFSPLVWEDGERGIFGSLSTTAWELILISDCTYNVDSLPMLVRTLEQLHRSNLELAAGNTTTHVLMATKPRHESEELFYRLMEEGGWECHSKVTQPTPEVFAKGVKLVSMYLFSKGPQGKTGE